MFEILALRLLNINFYIEHIKHQLFNYSFLIFYYVSHLHNCTFIFYFFFCLQLHFIRPLHSNIYKYF